MALPVTRFGIITSAVFVLPWLALLLLGGFWLWQHDWFYKGMAILSANFALTYCLFRWRRHTKKPVFVDTFTIEANPNWPGSAQPVWAELETVVEHWQKDVDVFTDTSKALQLTNQVLTIVAKHFHADSKRPVLEFPLPYLLKLIMLVCDDIQHEVLDIIPGSHAVRVGDFLRARQALHSINNLKSIFSVGHWLFNWPGAAMTHARGVLFSKGMHTVTAEVSSRLIEAYIKKLGYYAIELYSGQLTLDDFVATERLSSASKKDISESLTQDKSIEPLRFLVLGQVSSGKSSLINALFGDIKCASGILPTTTDITPYILERDGLQQAIILDSAGYGGLLQDQESVASKGEWKNIDVIIIVCNVTEAARKMDVLQLQAIRHYFQRECPNQALPVIIAVATHVDRLRPVREWNPPYQIVQPDNAKARNIRDACLAISQELHLSPGSVVPVCLAPDKMVYNVEEGLLPLIHENLNAAQRVRYLRCLRAQQAESYWRHWRKQAVKAGQILLDKV